MAAFGVAVFFVILFGSLAFDPALADPQSKVTICHTDPDNDGAGFETLEVNDNSVAKHLEKHQEDHLGTCFVCGDNFTDPPTEECDDGGTVDGDGCSAVCLVEFCGDGTTNDAPNEECDGSDLDGMDCTNFGFEQGQLSCASCSFDTSNCFEE